MGEARRERVYFNRNNSFSPSNNKKIVLSLLRKIADQMPLRMKKTVNKNEQVLVVLTNIVSVDYT
jgi:hypothetical protein